MNGKNVATGLNATRKYLSVYYRNERLIVPRTEVVKVPWALLADCHQDIVEGNERVFMERLKADADQQYLPLEKWE